MKDVAVLFKILAGWSRSVTLRADMISHFQPGRAATENQTQTMTAQKQYCLSAATDFYRQATGWLICSGVKKKLIALLAKPY